MYRVLISGDRNGIDGAIIEREVRALIGRHGKTHLIGIGGGASGVDLQCELTFKRHSVHFARVDALWDTRYRGAGPQRNTAMLGLQPDELIAFHIDIKNSKGTKDMVKQAEKLGIPTRVVRR